MPESGGAVANTPVQMGPDDLRRMNSVLRHRLRNFASGIKSAMSLIAKESEDKLEPETREYFPLIANECNILTDLTNRLNLVFEGNFERGGDEAAGAVMAGAVESLRAAVPTSIVNMSAGNGADTAVVPASCNIVLALREVLINAAEASGRREIGLYADLSGENATFTVSDEGRGVAPADLDKIFMPFFTTKSRHLGIGLTIAKRLLADAGGEISATANKPAGLIVTIAMPLRR